MVIHLIDGTYELFRQFYGRRRAGGGDRRYGAVIGVLTWISGLIADRMSLTGLVLTIALSMLGLLVSYLLIEAVLLAPLWAPQSWAAREQPAVPLILIYTALAAPLAGAMAGYYLPWRRRRAQEQ